MPENLLITDVDTIKNFIWIFRWKCKIYKCYFNTDTDVDKVTSKFKDIPTELE